ncbi:tRNA-uridine aminocarboxypropyltransferase [Thalassomonas sp. M1454]|uniref:tRNA-uridine aminocarboxypropyltransferase n=1 Tax=Thalassomonas sp. M1454 TaxID=2594477 RepID=UPI00163DA48A|nr:tRNA-uridine aminocarboxypropyltransferase [Thalassomonas sp. M1454]
MSRQYCTSCERPLVTCICKFCCSINNEVEVWFLQHTSEEKQAKGTAKLASLCLTHSKILIGEDFSDNQQLNKLLTDPSKQVYLLYPEQSAVVAKALTKSERKNTVILILDGTWKKAYLMYQLSTNLHPLAKITLASGIKSEYRIRKHHKESDVSSLEACAHALVALEDDKLKYQPLFNSFAQFNDFQLSLRKNNQK